MTQLTATPASSSTPADALSGVPRDLFLGGEWLPASAGGRMSVINPATEQSPDRRRRRRRARCPSRAPRRRARRQESWSRTPARSTLGDPVPRLRADDRAHRSPRAADDARDGQAAARGPRRGRVRGGVLPLVRRGGRPRRRRLRPPPRRGGPQPPGQAAGRPVAADHPVELPARDGRPQARSGDRGRLRQHPEAGAADPALLAGARADPGRRRSPRGCAQRRDHQPGRRRSSR